MDCGSLTAKGQKFEPTHSEEGKSGEPKAEWQKLPKIDQKTKPKKDVKGVPDDLNWFDEGTIRGYSKMGDPSTTAQVHPYLFTTSMADLAVEGGAEIILGSVTALDYTGHHGIKSVTYEDKDTKKIHTIPATDVILAAGPWTSHIFPDAPIAATRAHSIVVKADVSPHAIFSEIQLPAGFGKSGKPSPRQLPSVVGPELYPRPDGTVYICGTYLHSVIRFSVLILIIGDADQLIPLPKSSDLVQCDLSRCQDILDYVSTVSAPLRNGEVLARQACYLPSVESGGGPLIGETGIRGLLIASGHTCWGIQNSCATGKLMSEFIFEGKAKSAKIDTLDPRTFF